MKRIINKSNIEVSAAKMKGIKSLFNHSVYNFPWNGFLKDRKGYYQVKLNSFNDKRTIYRITIPGESFSLNVHAFVAKNNIDKHDMPYCIYITR